MKAIFCLLSPSLLNHTFGQKYHHTTLLYDDANKHTYDRVDCFPYKSEQHPTYMKLFKL